MINVADFISVTSNWHIEYQRQAKSWRKGIIRGRDYQRHSRRGASIYRMRRSPIIQTVPLRCNYDYFVQVESRMMPLRESIRIPRIKQSRMLTISEMPADTVNYTVEVIELPRKVACWRTTVAADYDMMRTAVKWGVNQTQAMLNEEIEKLQDEVNRTAGRNN